MNQNERRQAILDDLQLQMYKLHTRRRQRRVVVTTAGLLLGLAGYWQYNSSWRALQHDSTLIASKAKDTTTEHFDSGSTRSESLAKWIRGNSPGVVDRYVVAISSDLPSIELTEVDDEELLSLLIQAGHPSHLGTINGSKVVVPLKLPQEPL